MRGMMQLSCIAFGIGFPFLPTYLSIGLFEHQKNMYIFYYKYNIMCIQKSAESGT